MSRLNRSGKIIFALAMVFLALSLSIPAMGANPNKAPSADAPADNQASPGVPSGPAGKGAINVTPGTSTHQGHGKIGNLHAPPVIVKNLTQKVKKHANDARLNQTRAIAEGRINLIINQLRLYEKWVANSRLSDDQKSSIKAIIDGNIAWFMQQYEDIGATVDVATAQALADQADRQAAMLKVSMKKEAGIMACDMLDGRIATARNASAGIADRIASLEGIDTASAVQKLADYDDHVDAAARYSGAVRAAFECITTADNTDSGFNEGYRQIGMADREMARAYADLKSIYLWYLQVARQGK